MGWGWGRREVMVRAGQVKGGREAYIHIRLRYRTPPHPPMRPQPFHYSNLLAYPHLAQLFPTLTLSYTSSLSDSRIFAGVARTCIDLHIQYRILIRH